MGSSDYVDIRAWLEAETARRERERAWGIPTTYAGTDFRSRLEASWASTLDGHGIRWEYEPETVTLPSGARYLPDFRLPELATVIEVKGPHMQRLGKTAEYARQVAPGVLVLIGYPPQYRRLTEWSGTPLMQWGSPLAVMTAFTLCMTCRASQWCAPRYSMRCRRCGEPFTGHFAGCGEMRFEQWREDISLPPELEFMRGGASLMTWFRLDDSFHSHPKVIAAGNEAVGLFVRCGTYAAEHTTDGFIAEEIAELYGASATGSRRNPATGKPETLAETLVRTALWHRARRGWTIHDYLDYNPSRVQVEKERKAAAERQRRRRGLDRGFTSKVPVDNDENSPVDTRNRSSGGNSSRRDSRRDNGVSHTTPTRRVGRTESHPPDPPRSDARASPPGSPAVAARPPWCGECDERTRLVGDPDRPQRCPRCHPLATAEAS